MCGYLGLLIEKGENSADDDRYNKEIGMKSIISLIGATLLSVMPAFANIAEGVSGDCKWVIDNDGNLSISSEIDNAVLGTWEGNSAPWSNFKEEITTVVFSTPVIAKTCTNMFNGCTNLRSIYLDNFYTNEVTDMSNMFANCASLEIVEFNMTSSSFDDDDAFACYSKGLVSDRGNFITSSVKTMAGMFSGCKSLLSFYLPNLDMHSVTDFSEMFADCSSLESMDLTTLTIPKNANVSNMFRNCRNLMNIINQNIFPSPIEDATFISLPTRGICTVDVPMDCFEDYESAIGWMYLFINADDDTDSDDTASASLQSTSIINMTANDESATSIFGFGGERLSTPAKGLNIIDGKKVMVK